MRESYQLQFDPFPALRKEIQDLRQTVQTQQEALNATYIIIDELREENQLLRKNLYLDKLHNEIGKYKQLWIKSSEEYSKLSTRYELLMSKYIRSE